MVRVASCVLVLALLGTLPLPAADPPKDTAAAAFTRGKLKKGKVTLDVKNEFLKAVFEEISSQLQDQKLGVLSVHNGLGVSLNTRVTYAGQAVTVEEALDGILKQLDLGYHVVTKEKDRYDGWIELNKGNHRGYPPGTTAPKTEAKPDSKVEPKKPDPKVVEPKKPDPKPVASNDPDEKQAGSRLNLAKECIEMGKKDDAARLLKYILKNYPKTKAAEDAKELMEKIK